jgi:hypothetical protein
MGGHVSGLAIMDGPDVYDMWVDASAVTNWIEWWVEISATEDDGDTIAHDAGGTPTEVPLVYVDRSPALNPTAFLASGLERAYLIAGLGDTTATPDDAQQLAVNLAHQGVPVSLYMAIDSGDPAEPPGHRKYGFDLVLDRAEEPPSTPVPFVEGVYDVSTEAYTPPT